MVDQAGGADNSPVACHRRKEHRELRASEAHQQGPGMKRAMR
jgi:hypothetical protein